MRLKGRTYKKVSKGVRSMLAIYIDSIGDKSVTYTISC